MNMAVSFSTCSSFEVDIPSPYTSLLSPLIGFLWAAPPQQRVPQGGVGAYVGVFSQAFGEA